MNQLALLQSPALLDCAATISTAQGLRSFLRARAEVVGIRKALSSGELTPVQLKVFVRDLLRGFTSGRKFTDEIILAVIAVAVETLPGSFADEYLRELAALKVGEIPLAPRVAALALVERQLRVAGLTERVEVVSRLMPGARMVASSPVDAGSSIDEYRLAS